MALLLESITKLLECINQVERDLTLVREQVEELALEAMKTPPADGDIPRLFNILKPRSKEVISALERAAQLADGLRGVSEEERRARFFQNLEKIRAQAIERGTAIDDEREAAIDD